MLDGLLQNRLELVWTECVPLALEELVLELNPVKTESVQHALQGIHAHQHEEGHPPEDGPANDAADDGCSIARISYHDALEGQVEEHLSQLGVGKRQSPQSEVGGSVGHSSQHELNGLDQLMNKHLAEVVGVTLSSQALESFLDVSQVLGVLVGK